MIDIKMSVLRNGDLQKEFAQFFMLGITCYFISNGFQLKVTSWYQVRQESYISQSAHVYKQAIDLC